jgi:hypothetical protein
MTLRKAKGSARVKARGGKIGSMVAHCSMGVGTIRLCDIVCQRASVGRVGPDGTEAKDRGARRVAKSREDEELSDPSSET